MEAKTALLSDSFFPASPEADLADINDILYPEQLPFPEIPHHEIEGVIRSTPPDKAPGEDGILNSFRAQDCAHLRSARYALLNLQCLHTNWLQSVTLPTVNHVRPPQRGYGSRLPNA